MNDRLTTRTRYPQAASGGVGRRCQVERCSLPPSLLPWLLDRGGVTLELSLCHYHGPLVEGNLFLASNEEAA